MWWTMWWLSFREIRRNLMRSFLTILGIVIGVAAVITMVTVGHGATLAVRDQIASLGSNLLLARPGQRMSQVRDAVGAPSFKEADAEAVASEVAGVQAVAPAVSRGATVVWGGRNWSTVVTGTTPAYLVTNNWTLASGRGFTEGEVKSGAAVCWVGETVRRELFGQTDPLGAQLRVAQFSCQVIGLLAAKGQAAMGQDQDDSVVLPLATVQRRLTGSTHVGTLMISVREGVDTQRVQKQIEALLRERRKLRATEENNFNLLDTRQIAEALSGTTRVMTLLLGAVAAVSLVVGGIGIMNIMWVSVTERTREIGIRLAIGALQSEVQWQFLIEAVVLSCVGGVLGILVAALACVGLSRLMGMGLEFDALTNAASFAFSALIGVVFGVVPARRAARLDPIEALRHE